MLCIVCNKKIDSSDTLLLNAKGVHNDCLNLFQSVSDTPYDSERHKLEKSILDKRKERADYDAIASNYVIMVTSNNESLMKLKKEKRNLNSTFSKVVNMFNSNFNERLIKNENLIKEAESTYSKALAERDSILNLRKERELKFDKFISETNLSIEDIYKKISKFKDQRKQKLFEIYNYWLERPPDWESRRELILNEQNFCNSCGELDLLHIHHKRQIRDGGTHKLENLEVLCEYCHSDAHGGKKFRYRKKERKTAYSKHYKILQKAIGSKQPLMLHYEKYNGEKSQRVIYPKLFERWGESLLVETHCTLRDDMRRFNLIRIKKLKVVKENP